MASGRMPLLVLAGLYFVGRGIWAVVVYAGDNWTYFGIGIGLIVLFSVAITVDIRRSASLQGASVPRLIGVYFVYRGVWAAVVAAGDGRWRSVALAILVAGFFAAGLVISLVRPLFNRP